LPGIGPYTASAVAAIAFGARVAAVDVNVGRVLSRVFAGRDRVSAVRLRALAQAALPRWAAGEWAQALMDLGTRYCRAQPRCEECPARKMCRYVRADHQRKRSHSSGSYVGSNRFYRGRIVRVLSVHDELSLRALGRKVKEGFALSDLPWLHELLRALAHDGLVRVRQGRARLA
jgi:A/G-specific adenine glycosylase